MKLCFLKATLFRVKRGAFSRAVFPIYRVCLIEAMFVGRSVDARAKAARISGTSFILSPYRFPPLLSSSNLDPIFGLVSMNNARKTRVPLTSPPTVPSEMASTFRIFRQVYCHLCGRDRGNTYLVHTLV